MKNAVKYLFIFLSILFVVYLLLPTPEFPKKLEDSIRSGEPADMETSLRREYYTQSMRNDVIKHYLAQFKDSGVYFFPTYRLNYPPEEAQTRIRDQTRSSYLEEIVHPFRESVYVNGFEPKMDQDAIVIDGKVWNSKVVVRYYKSSALVRVMVGLLTLLVAYMVFKEWKKEIVLIINYLRSKRWIFR